MPAAPRPVPVPASIPDDDEPGLNDLYDLAEPQAGTSTIESGTRCPQCNSLMDDGAVLCMNCGYDTRTGKALSPVAVSPSSKSAKVTAVKKGKKPTDMMAPQGSFVVGLVTSAALALAASVVWILVAWATGYAIGYIAILIGAAAGTGMKTGQKGFSSAGGMVAAGMTVGAILFAKLAVVEILLSQKGMHVSVFDLDAAKLGFYLFSPISLIFMVIGMGAAYRTANGSVSG